MITMQDVALHAKVSQATVSRVINGSALVSDETKAIVMQSIRELNYQQNLTAKTLAHNRSLIIALVIPDLLNYFFIDILFHLEKDISANGYSLLLFNSDGNNERERSIAKTLKSRQVDGVIAALVTENSVLKEELASGTIPTVIISQDYEGFDCVSVSHEAGGALAARSLMEMGYNRFLFAGASDDPKYIGYRNYLVANGVSPEMICLIEIGHVWFHTSEKVFRAVQELYARGNDAEGGLEVQDTQVKPGFFCVNDLIALGVMQALQNLNIVIGSEAGVVGFDDTHICSSLKPRLTSVSQPKEEMARIAVELLLRRIHSDSKKKSEFEHILLEPRLAKRESV